MPTYDYSCAECGVFDAFRSIALRDEAATCALCGGLALRVLSSAPRLALMELGTRRAMDANDRARHEPQRSGEYSRFSHPPGCGCCTSGKRGATVTAANGNKAFPTKRPWMISH